MQKKCAIIYHLIENEQAIRLCCNATNGKGCYIRYHNTYLDDKLTWFGNHTDNKTIIKDEDTGNKRG